VTNEGGCRILVVLSRRSLGETEENNEDSETGEPVASLSITCRSAFLSQHAVTFRIEMRFNTFKNSSQSAVIAGRLVQHSSVISSACADVSLLYRIHILKFYYIC
jgi:hypothetical protein